MPAKTWTSAEALAWTAGRFASAGITTARLDAELLLARALDCGRVDLYARSDRPLASEERSVYRALIERRLAGEPVAYIVGTKSFRYLTLAVTPAALVPRPETELLVEVALEFAGDRAISVADVGTGSGAVAVSLAKEIDGATVYATDASEDALALAAANAELAGVVDRITFAHGDLLDPLPAEVEGTLDAVVSNPPYIPAGEIEQLPREIRDFEPRRALDGGSDGTTLLRRLIETAPRYLREGGLLAVEVGEGQANVVSRVMGGDFGDVRATKDLAGVERVVAGLRRNAPCSD